jgi:nucleoside-diphosphate-sugar epimerase
VKVLLLGVTGFIGRCIYDNLVKENIEVVLFSRKLVNVSSDVYLFKDAQELKQLAQETKNIDAVINCIGVTGSNESELKHSYVNIDINKILIQYVFFANNAKYIFISSADVYKDLPTIQTEVEAVESRNLYTKYKLIGECTVIDMSQKYGINPVIIRPSLIFGKSDNQRFFVNQMIDSIHKEQIFEMTKGRQERDFLYVGDLANAIVRISKSSKLKNVVYNISYGVSISLYELATRVFNALELKDKLKVGAVNYTDNERYYYKISSKRFKDEFEHFPEIKIYNWIINYVRKK